MIPDSLKDHAIAECLRYVWIGVAALCIAFGLGAVIVVVLRYLCGGSMEVVSLMGALLLACAGARLLNKEL